MDDGAGGRLRSVPMLPMLVLLMMLMLPVPGLSGALTASWTPGEYPNTAADALRFLGDYNATAEEVFFNSMSASWNYNTNITDHNAKLQVGQLMESCSGGWVGGDPVAQSSPLTPV